MSLMLSSGSGLMNLGPPFWIMEVLVSRNGSLRTLKSWGIESWTNGAVIFLFCSRLVCGFWVFECKWKGILFLLLFLFCKCLILMIWFVLVVGLRCFPLRRHCRYRCIRTRNWQGHFISHSRVCTVMKITSLKWHWHWLSLRLCVALLASRWHTVSYLTLVLGWLFFLIVWICYWLCSIRLLVKLKYKMKLPMNVS